MSDPVQPREVLVFGTSGDFRKEDYPWLVAVRVYLKAGDSGAADADGEAGYVLVELYDTEPSA